MKKHLVNIVTFLFIFLLAFIYSCNKQEETSIGPTIQFKTGNGFIHSDTTVLIGKSFKVGIVAEKGEANITNFMIKITNGSTQTYLDSGLNSPGFVIDKYFTKGVSQEEIWTFIVRDKSGKSASLSLKIYADSNSVFGSVVTIPSIILGAQNNTTTGSFLDIKNVAVYDLAQAYLVQDSIELCYYYDFLQGEDHVIASPGANIDVSVFPGQYTLSNWAVKNETRYLETTLNIADFNAVSNDSLLIASYIAPAKKKAKNLLPGEIYSFKTAKGKFGLFRVLNVVGTDAGTVEIMVKMQAF